MAVLNISPFDADVYAAMQKRIPRNITIKQFVTEAICEKLRVPIPAQPKRGAPKKKI